MYRIQQTWEGTFSFWPTCNKLLQKKLTTGSNLNDEIWWWQHDQAFFKTGKVEMFRADGKMNGLGNTYSRLHVLKVQSAELSQ